MNAAGLLVLGALLQTPVHAQVPARAVGFGAGVMSRNYNSFGAVHAQASLRIAEVSRRFHVRAGAFHQRSGANQLSALDASLVTQFGARMHLYFILVGVGPYYRRMPRGSADCDPASSLTACPELEDISALGVAITNGVGIALPVGGAWLFAESRARIGWDREGRAGGIPFTLGVAF